MVDAFNLERFVTAQAETYATALAELREGRKRTHWMWFIFPQLSGLGHSSTARHFAIASVAEAQAFLSHPLLGMRLRDCTTCVNRHVNVSATQIFGTPDDVKLRSSMTLFSLADPAEPVFGLALEKYFQGELDSATLRLLADPGASCLSACPPEGRA